MLLKYFIGAHADHTVPYNIARGYVCVCVCVAMSQKRPIEQDPATIFAVLPHPNR